MITPLARDDRGAMMVLGLAMAVFLTAALYYVVGIGQALDQRETMQDAADAGAFSVAALHAHGMNLIALLNVIMAALLAILVALKLLETVLALAIVLLAIAAFFGGGPAAAAIPEVEVLRREVHTAHETLRPGIHSSLRALHSTARGVRAVVPWTAQLRALGVIRRHTPYVDGGFALPASIVLATEDGKFGDLCTEAGSYVGRTAKLAIRDLPGGVDEEVGDALGSLANAGADWFCGASGASPPKTTITERRVLPTLPERERCEAQMPGNPAYDPARQAALCAEAARVEAASAPDPLTGDCRSPECFARAELAREACRPSDDVALSDWMYQTRQVHKKWGYRHGAKPIRPEDVEVAAGTWRFVTAEVRKAPALVVPDPDRANRTPPCGTSEALVGPAWNDAWSGDAPPRPLPVCVEAARFPPLRVGTAKAFHAQDVTEVTQVFGCTRKVRRTLDVGDVAGDDRLEQGDDSAKSPQVVADTELGGERYQIRAVALGKLPGDTPERVIETASWGAAPESAAAGGPSSLGRVAFAQAEYFYAVEDPAHPDPSRWLWNTGWSARLRRFRMPEPAARAKTEDVDAADAARWGAEALPTDLGDACSRRGEAEAEEHAEQDADHAPCGSLLDQLDSIESLILH